MRMSKKNGFAVIDVMIAIAVMAMLIPVAIHYFRSGAEKLTQRQAAEQMGKVVEAAGVYVRDKGHELLAITGPGVGVTRTLADLRSDGYLPSMFSDRNAWDQTYSIHIWQPTPGNLQALVLTRDGRGGAADNGRFNSLVVPEAAAMVGAQGGFVTQTDPTVIKGTFGGWELNLTSTPFIPLPGPGRMAGLVHFSRGELRNDYLYRVEVPGRPELNQMEVHLDMRGFNIDNVSVVEFDPDPVVDCSVPGQVFYSAAGLGGSPPGLYGTVDGQCRYLTDQVYVDQEITNLQTIIENKWHNEWRPAARSDARSIVDSATIEKASCRTTSVWGYCSGQEVMTWFTLQDNDGYITYYAGCCTLKAHAN